MGPDTFSGPFLHSEHGRKGIQAGESLPAAIGGSKLVLEVDLLAQWRSSGKDRRNDSAAGETGDMILPWQPLRDQERE